jgi:hypothetical protein
MTTKKDTKRDVVENPVSEKITKSIRLDKALEMRVKEAAFKRTVEAGKRVTESEIIELALLKFLAR